MNIPMATRNEVGGRWHGGSDAARTAGLLPQLDDHDPQRHTRGARDPADPVDHRARDPVAPAERPRERRNLAAAVAGELHVVSEQRLQAREVALLGGRKEPSCQLVALLARRLEAGPALLDVASGAGRELAYVVLALADDRRDLRIAVLEHVAKQQHRTLLWREVLQQHQHR